MDKEKLDRFLYQKDYIERQVKLGGIDIFKWYERLNGNIVPITKVSKKFKKDDSRKYINKFVKNLVSNTNFYDDIAFFKGYRFFPVPIHYHDEFVELCYIYSGESRQVINGDYYRFVKGEFCLLGAETVHFIEEGSEDDIIIYCIIRKAVLTSAFLSQIEDEQELYRFFLSFLHGDDQRSFFTLRTRDESMLQDFFQLIMYEYFFSNLSIKMIESYTLTFLQRLFSIEQTLVDKKTSVTSKRANSMHIIHYINEHLQTVNLKKAAEHFGYNPQYFGRMFKEISQNSFVETVKEYRIAKTVDLLVNTDININEICQIVGYKNTSYFYRLFSEHFGVTPLEYRKTFLNSEGKNNQKSI